MGLEDLIELFAVRSVGPLEMLVVLAVAILLFGKNWRELAARLQEGIDNFRGGPGSPTHPIPADDSKLVNRTRKSSKSDPAGPSPH